MHATRGKKDAKAWGYRVNLSRKAQQRMGSEEPKEAFEEEDTRDLSGGCFELQELLSQSEKQTTKLPV